MIQPQPGVRQGSVLLASLLVFACGEPDAPAGIETGSNLTCTIPRNQIFDGGPGKDGIPALENPPLVGADEPGLEYLENDDRVIGLLWNGQAIAVPHNIGWWHEIVNLDLDGLQVAVTFCPLTGSSLAFDRGAADGATFGVSGLLYQNNMIMYDRNQPESLWPQMTRGARCGARSGAGLTMIPIVEMRWAAWRGLHPNTLVVSGDLDLGRDYRLYPYGSYDEPGNTQLLFPLDNVDRRRAMKERVLGIPSEGGDGGIAFPFDELALLGAAAVIEHVMDGEDIVILWDGFGKAAMAYRPRAAGQTLTLEVRQGAIEDRETRSSWDVDGVSRSGPLLGERLEPVAEAYVSFWFAWAAFHTGTKLWTGDGVS
ncbi:MAG: DUF3179 domain-containing protein [Longimicrobiales bacterium]